jgi:hypothetical protein
MKRNTIKNLKKKDGHAATRECDNLKVVWTEFSNLRLYCVRKE